MRTIVAALVDDVHVDVVGAVQQVERDAASGGGRRRHTTAPSTGLITPGTGVGYAGDQRRRDLQVLGDEERGDGRQRRAPRTRRRQPPHNRTTATFGTSNSWNASSPRGSAAQSITRIEPPWADDERRQLAGRADSSTHCATRGLTARAATRRRGSASPPGARIHAAYASGSSRSMSSNSRPSQSPRLASRRRAIEPRLEPDPRADDLRRLARAHEI